MNAKAQKMMKRNRFFLPAVLLVLLSLLTIPTDVAAQNRSDLRQSISEWGRCRTVAITRSKGDIAICENATYAFSGTMIGLFNLVKELYGQDTYISDIQANEEGAWLILYGDNEMQWKGIPASLEKTLNDFKAAGDVISLATFNARGEWIAVTNNQISASHNHLAELLTTGMEECGDLVTACVSEECAVLVFENGVRSSGNPPADLMEALQSGDMRVRCVKISYNDWFIAGPGSYQYSM